MIGIFTRWSLNLSAVTADEKWTVFEELAADLYPSGPDHNELWDRAGGRNWDLQTFGNGRSRWRDAISQIRRGKGPRSSRLLSEMKRDFPLNDQVRYLANDSDLGAHR
nr:MULTISPECIES: effector-associated domain EAD1-containing protein [unclassified Rhizobium]